MSDGQKVRTWLYIFIYLVIYEGILSGAVSGGINFAISYGMYAKRGRQVTLWKFPHTMSGDCAVTLFVQVIITQLIEELIIGWDCYRGDLFYFPHIGLRERLYKWVIRIWELENGIIPFPLTDEGKAGNKPKYSVFLRKLVTYKPEKNLFVNLIIFGVHKVLISLAIAIPIWFVLWPVTMGVLAGIGKSIGGIDYELGNYPEPQIIKLVYTAILGLISTPMSIAAIILRNQWYTEFYYSNTSSIDKEKHKESELENSENDVLDEQSKSTSSDVFEA